MAIGDYRHRVTVQGPLGAAVADAEGGYLQVYASLTPADWYCSIVPATQRDLERVTAGTVMASASHVVTGRYRADITTQTRLIFQNRTLHVSSVANLEERNVTLQLVCQEIVA